ncbi:F-box domain-containing protein [Mycena venus]|uniref:F-box domain-containing protein n=1 Tax=Mycena venus TaxID=2733690 RepID=A0A8H6Y7T8_9AGAR|nr:F-box domain-containing protein [Mycena venus]
MSIHFLNLPSEILVLILCSLDLPSLVACIATNRRVKSLIEGSALLQYRLAAQATCVEDNPFANTNMTSADRLFALQKRQTAFAELRPSSIRTIHMVDCPISTSALDIYSCSGGIFAMTESTNQSLRWISLACVGQQAPVWEHLELDEYILEFTLAVPAADLLVVLTSTAPLVNPIPSNAFLKLRFYELSTGRTHREAQEPVIILPLFMIARPDFEVDICGPRVSVVMEYLEDNVEQPNRLLIYDWKKGQLQMDLADDYAAALFLSTDIILAVRKTGVFDLWAIPDVPEGITGPEISLYLPQLPENHEYFMARVEYNPKGSHPTASHQPFHSSLVDSLVLLNILRVSEPPSDSQNMFLIIPRRALLQQLPSAENRGEERMWADWGPSITRWLSADIFTEEWPATTCGQRCAFIMQDRSLLLLDFNPYTWKKTLLEQGKQIDRSAIPVMGRLGLGPSELYGVDELEFFGEQARSQLGFVGKKTGVTTWDGAVMDEEWIVGIKDTREWDGKFSLEVWHLG